MPAEWPTGSATAELLSLCSPKCLTKAASRRKGDVTHPSRRSVVGRAALARPGGACEAAGHIASEAESRGLDAGAQRPSS